MFDKTEYFIEETTENAQGKLDNCLHQNDQIEAFYSDFMKYIGDDPTKLPIDEFLSIMKKFGTTLEEGKKKFLEKERKAKKRTSKK